MTLPLFPPHSRCNPFQFFIWTLLLLTPLYAGDDIPFAKKVFRADVILEVELHFSKPIPRAWPNKAYDPQGWGFPDKLIGEAAKNAIIGRILYSKVDTIRLSLPGSIFLFSSGSPCWWKAHKRSSLRVLLFFMQEPDGSLKQVFGVEQETGQYTDLNPHYGEMVSAIQTARAWPEERMRAVASGMLWQTQKQLLTESPNVYLVELARVFLSEHEAGSARQYWSDEREKAHAEAFQTRIHSMVCR